MTIIARGFIGARLIQARRARGISGTDLADIVGVSDQSISKYENNHQSPRMDVLLKLSEHLTFPYDYFLRPIPTKDERPVFWRGRLTAPPVARERAAVRLEWMKEVVDYIANYFDLPICNIPEIDFPDDGIVDSEFIERVAAEIRDYWQIRNGPMPDTIEYVENNGILVSRIHISAEKLDAFSQWSDRFNLPFVVLSRNKASAVRQRYDILHELVHIVIHSNIRQRRLNDRAFYKMIEKQADQIASAMLLPAYEFTSELYAPSLDAFLTLKERWGASVAAMIMRCQSLDILDGDSAKRLWINYNRRRWRNGEPFDGKMEKEEPQLIRRSFEMLIEEGVQSPPEIIKALPFPTADLEEIAGIQPGTLSNATQSRAAPELREEFRKNSNVVSLFREKN